MSEYIVIDQMYLKFIDSLDLSIPDNDCEDYREQDDYKAIAFSEKEISRVKKELKEKDEGIQFLESINSRLEEARVCHLESGLEKDERILELEKEQVRHIEIIEEQFNSRIREVKNKLAISVELIKMVEDNSKMPHNHEDYYLRLCCLSERAKEALKQIGEMK